MITKYPFRWGRFVSIMKKEFIQVKRDPISMRLPIIMPIMLMMLFGYAVKTEVDTIPTVVLDQSNSKESRTYIEQFAASQYFVIHNYVYTTPELHGAIESGRAGAGLIIPEDYEERMATALSTSGEPAEILLLIDGSDPTTARTALSSGILVSRAYAQGNAPGALTASGTPPSSGTLSAGSATLHTRVLYNPNMDNNRFTIPGLVGLILQNITVMLTAFALVREKERGTIEQLMVTPVRPSELILGKLIPYIVIGYAGFLFSLALAIFWFKVSVAGNVFLLLILGLLFVICSLSMGMLISTFAQNQLQAMMVMILIILPSILLSGFIFPRAAMPVPVRLVGYAIPLTYFLHIIRGIMIKGVSPELLLGDTTALLVFTLVIIFIAVKRFRKSLD